MKKSIIKIAAILSTAVLSIIPIASSINANAAYNSDELYGDANRDGKVTSEDSLLILKYSLGMNVGDINLRLADVNKDGFISKIDCSLVNKAILGKQDFNHRFGDVDQNGKIELVDVVMINRYINGMETFTKEQNICADVTGDSEIDAEDSVCLLRYLTNGYFCTDEEAERNKD